MGVDHLLLSVFTVVDIALLVIRRRPYGEDESRDHWFLTRGERQARKELDLSQLDG